MPTFTSENRTMWQSLFDSVAPQCPSVGKRVTVTGGKHAGKSGLVTWHGRDQYSSLWRYGSDAQTSLREARGRDGYRIRVETANGESFFIAAEKVEVNS